MANIEEVVDGRWAPVGKLKLRQMAMKVAKMRVDVGTRRCVEGVAEEEYE